MPLRATKANGIKEWFKVRSLYELSQQLTTVTPITSGELQQTSSQQIDLSYFESRIYR
jgi:hypothetical protein